MLSDEPPNDHCLLPLTVDQTLARRSHEMPHLWLHGHQWMATDVKSQGLFLVCQLLAVAPCGNRFEVRRIDICPRHAFPEEAELTLLSVLLLTLRPLQYPRHIP